MSKPIDMPEQAWQAHNVTRITPKVYEAINKVQAALAKEGIGKDRKNAAQGYSFRGIDDVYNALSPLLAQHGLCILPRMLSREVVERESAKGAALFYVTVSAEFDFVAAEDGSKHTVKTYGEAMDSGDKATNKAMSAAYKYAAMQAFAIPTEGDHDTETQTHEVKAKAYPSPVKSALAGEAISDEQNVKLSKVASALIDLVNQEHEEDADNRYKIWELVESIDDDAEKLHLWHLLGGHSKDGGHSRVRTRIKKIGEEERKAKQPA